VGSQPAESWPGELAAGGLGAEVDGGAGAALSVYRRFPIDGSRDLAVRLVIGEDGRVTVLEWLSIERMED